MWKCLKLRICRLIKSIPELGRDCKVVVGTIILTIPQSLQLFTVDWDTTEDLGTSAATSLGLELDFIGGPSTRTVSWEGVSLCTHWYTPLSYCCIHWDRFMKAWSYVLQCFSWWYTDVWDPIELQQSQGLLSMTPHRRQEQCCAMRGLHTIVSYHCRHCTDLWDWIGSQGLLFRDPTSSHAALAGQLDPCEVMIVSLQLKMSTATLSPDSNCSDYDKQFLNFGNLRE